MKYQAHTQQGMTLIELVVSIVILSVSLVAIIGVYSNSTINSATPMARIQANFIANAYLEEIMLRAYHDPDTDTGSCESGETSRALYDDVNDYDCVNDTNGAIDQNGNMIAGLEAYNIDVNVTGTTLNGAPAQKIDVEVTRDSLDSINIGLSAYRVNY